jgi:Primase C terminal 1 (PriCT-1)
VELPRLAPRRQAEIRTDGRNVETFDRLRHWAYGAIAHYRCGPRERWDEVVDARALMIAEQVRAAYPAASHPFSDHEALATAKSVADWVWLRYDGGSLTRVRADTTVRREKHRQRELVARRERGNVPREVYLAEVHRRRVAASTLRGLGVAIEDIARRLGAGVRSVHRWISEIRCVPSPCAPSDFEPRREPTLKQALLNLSEDFVDSVVGLVPCQGPGEGFPSAQPMGGTGCPARSAEPANGAADSGRGVRGETSVAESPMAYIQRRIREITSDAPRSP